MHNSEVCLSVAHLHHNHSEIPPPPPRFDVLVLVGCNLYIREGKTRVYFVIYIATSPFFTNLDTDKMLLNANKLVSCMYVRTRYKNVTVFVVWRGSEAIPLLGLRVRIPPGSWMSVFCEYFVLSGRDLYTGPIPRPE